MNAPLLHRPWPRLLWIALAFVALHQAATLQLWLFARASDPRAHWAGAAAVEGGLWLAWLILLPLVAWNCRRHHTGAWVRHGAVAMGIIALHVALMPLLRG